MFVFFLVTSGASNIISIAITSITSITVMITQPTLVKVYVFGLLPIIFLVISGASSRLGSIHVHMSIIPWGSPGAGYTLVRRGMI